MYKVMNCINRAPVYFDDAESTLIYAYSFNYPGVFIGYAAGLESFKKHYNLALKLFSDLDHYNIIHINGAAICACSDESSALILPGENTPPPVINSNLFTYTPDAVRVSKPAKTGPKTTNFKTTISINNKGQIII